MVRKLSETASINMKTPLAISDSEKYGKTSPEIALPSPSGKKPEDRKSVPTIDLVGPQVDAFCACSLKVGDSGTATVHYIVKSTSQGDSYGSELPKKGGSPQKVTLAISHVEAEDDGEGGDTTDEEGEESEGQEAPEADEADDDAEDAADGGADEAEEGEAGEKPEPKSKGGIGFKKKPISPSDADLEDED